MDRYLALLPREHHEAVLSSVAGVWLPVEVAIEHYRACDKLEIGDRELVEIGAEVAKHSLKTTLSVAVSLAKGAGVTPWTILEQLPVVWYRVWSGGGVAVYKIGPKDARLEVAGWQCAASHYCRVAVRGTIGGLVELFCQKAFVREVSTLCGPSTLAYRISWA
jgi:hypothetical protein